MPRPRRYRAVTARQEIKALNEARKAYLLDEKINFRFMSESDQKRWRERQKLIEEELLRIARLRPL